MSVTVTPLAGLPAVGGLPSVGYSSGDYGRIYQEPYGPAAIGFSRVGADVIGVVSGGGYGWQLQGLPAVGGMQRIGRVCGLPEVGRIRVGGLPSIGATVMNPQCDYPGGGYIRPGETQESFNRRMAICSSQPTIEQPEWYESLGKSVLETYAAIELQKRAQEAGVRLPQPAPPPMPVEQKAAIGGGIIAAIALGAFILTRKRGK